MAGHTSEKRWRRNQNTTFGNEGVSELASRVCEQMIAALDASQTAFDELQELYVYAGGTVQDLADQLFYEDWTVRSTPGTQAVITVDVAAGVVATPAVTVAGTGYTDGTGFTLNLVLTAGGGDGTAELAYDVVSGAITNPSITIAGATYNDGTDIVVQETPAAGAVFETQANAEELAKTQDLFDAITALKELNDAASNVAVTQEDRRSQLRRMS
jgi:hypothetical protein